MCEAVASRPGVDLEYFVIRPCRLKIHYAVFYRVSMFRKIGQTCRESVRFFAPFSVYVLWLLAFPMDGILSACAGSQNFLLWFLVPHAFSLLVTVHFLREERIFRRVSSLGIVLVVAVTALFPHCSGNYLPLAVLAGISSAPLAIKACSLIKLSVNPFRTAAAGLAAGNILLYLFSYLPLTDSTKAMVLAVLLLLPLHSPCVVSGNGSIRKLVKYLPFVFVFQLVSGLMYGFLMEEYAVQSFLKSSELLFYIVAVLGGVYVASRRLDALLALGVLSAMFSFSFLLGKTGLATNISMYAMQGATGFVDLFLLCLLLSCEGTSKALGYGLATTCFAIVGGKIASIVVGDQLSLIVSVANIILTLAVLLLYFKNTKSESAPIPSLETGGPILQDTTCAVELANDFPGWSSGLPRGFSKRFSAKEKRVLELVLLGKTFRVAAASLEISESSVKTYMKRIYEKTGVSSKTELVRLLEDMNGASDKY